MFLLDRLFKKMIRDGELTVIDASGQTYVYGVRNPQKPPVRVRFTTVASNVVRNQPHEGGFYDRPIVSTIMEAPAAAQAPTSSTAASRSNRWMCSKASAMSRESIMRCS